jgi:penicillin-binding protein 1A
MSAAVAKMPWRDFPRPSGLVTATVSSKDGLLAKDPKDKDAHTELFISGTQPTKISTYDPTKEKKPGDKGTPDGKSDPSKIDDKLPPPPPPQQRGDTSTPTTPPPLSKPATAKPGT